MRDSVSDQQQKYSLLLQTGFLRVHPLEWKTNGNLMHEWAGEPRVNLRSPEDKAEERIANDANRPIRSATADPFFNLPCVQNAHPHRRQRSSEAGHHTECARGVVNRRCLSRRVVSSAHGVRDGKDSRPLR